MTPASKKDNELLCEAYTSIKMKKCHVECLHPQDEFEIEALGTKHGLKFEGRFVDPGDAGRGTVVDLFTGTPHQIDHFFATLQDNKNAICDYGWPGEPNSD